MLYIRVEVWPNGNAHERKILGEATIDSVGVPEIRRDYAYTLSRFGGFLGKAKSVTRILEPGISSVWHSGVLEFPSFTEAPWELLYSVIRHALEATGDESMGGDVEEDPGYRNKEDVKAQDAAVYGGSDVQDR